MRRLAVSLAVLLALLFAADRAAGHALRAMFEDPRDGGTAQLLAGARSTPDVVITGSSRAKYHYVADSMSRWLGERVVNFGGDGQHAPQYHYAVASLLLTRHVPKLWVIEIDDPQIYGDAGLDHLDVLLPYAEQDASIHDMLAERSLGDRLSLVSRVYPYNSLLLSLVKSRRSPVYALPRDGYEEIDRVFRGGDTASDAQTAAHDLAEAPPVVNASKVRYLTALIDTLRRARVRVLAVRSPYLQRAAPAAATPRPTVSFLARLLAERCIRFVDLARDRDFSDPRMFADRGHLNREGSLLFSRQIADTLQSELQRPVGEDPCRVVARSKP